MTRPEKISKRKAFNKEVRAHAAHEKTSFATVLTRTLDVQKTRSYRSMMNLPSHAPRTTKRVPTNKQSLDSGDDDDDEADDQDIEHTELVSDEGKVEKSSLSLVVDLMGMAKPAKPKGVAKEYEVVGKVREVITLEDDDDYFGEYEADGDEWEEVGLDYVSKGGGTSAKQSYSAALRGR